MTEAREAELVGVVLGLPVVRVELVLVLETPGGGGDVDHQTHGDCEVGAGHRVGLGAGPLHG